MNKFKITRKEIKENYRAVSVPYCALQSLLDRKRPIAYNAGVYGWNYDVYDFRWEFSTDICICTGYRGYPGIPVDYNIYTKYEEKAKEILLDGYTYQESEKLLNKLIREFLNEVEEKYFKN